MRAAAAPRPRTRVGIQLLAHIQHAIQIRRWPGAGPVVGTMPAGSPWGQPIVAWVMRLAHHRRFGEVPVPFAGGNREGWIDLRGVPLTRSPIHVHVVLSRHLVEVDHGERVVFRFTAAIGSPLSPTPPGRYFVTDRVRFWPGSEYGIFAFGISGIQTHLPPGWAGGDQLAIHGTNDPASIGRSVSAGCVRVSTEALLKLEPLLQVGTPVVISP